MSTPGEVEQTANNSPVYYRHVVHSSTFMRMLATHSPHYLTTGWWVHYSKPNILNYANPSYALYTQQYFHTLQYNMYCSMQWKAKSAVVSASYYLRVHSLSGGSPSALKYPAKQGHSDSPRCVLLLLAGQGRQVMFMDRYIPESQPLEGGEGKKR